MTVVLEKMDAAYKEVVNETRARGISLIPSLKRKTKISTRFVEISSSSQKRTIMVKFVILLLKISY